jgi:myo-inositol-1(or 4)-monophosphatase
LSSSTAAIDLARLAPQLAETVVAAGEVALDYYRKGAQRWMKADQSPVTEADIAVDRFLRERLPPLVPDAAWLSEETVDTPERLGAHRVWIVDPIDGTRAFIERVPHWVVSVALVEAGRPIAGVVFNPCSGEAFAAELGRGARLGDRPLAASPGANLEGALAAGPRRVLDRLASTGMRQAPWIHALANRFVRVAAARLDVAIARADAHDWDVAAADLILTEAGARMTGPEGEDPIYNRPVPRHGALLAAGAARHRALIAAVQAGSGAAPPAPQAASI